MQPDEPTKKESPTRMYVILAEAVNDSWRVLDRVVAINKEDALRKAVSHDKLDGGLKVRAVTETSWGDAVRVKQETKLVTTFVPVEASAVA